MLLSTFEFFSAVCEDSFPIKGRFKVRVRLKVRVNVTTKLKMMGTEYTSIHIYLRMGFLSYSA